MSNDQGWRQESTVLDYNATPHVVLPDPPENIAAEAGNGYASSLSIPHYLMAMQTFFNTLFFVIRAIL
jgi:hypothetical protein